MRMEPALKNALVAFAREKKFRGQGPLCVALVTTRHARTMGLPLDPDVLLTQGGGQVRGLGRGAVQAILAKYKINRVLAQEGGRTSRGSLRNMRDYVDLLNRLHKAEIVDFDAVEAFWISKVEQFFAGKPFKIKLDNSKSLRTVVRDVIAQAEDRQRTSPGTYYAGAVLQHLVGAKIDCALGPDLFDHNSFSTADAPGDRPADFLIKDVAIHVTTSPSEAVIDRCAENLDDGHRPIVVTLQKGLSAAEVLAGNKNIAERIDVFEIEQFVALNLYELAKFAPEGRRMAVTELVERYNHIIEKVETDPSLQIKLRR